VPDLAVPSPLDRILPAFVGDLRATLGDDFVGAYLYGSAVSGGFEAALSDLDVVVVTERPVDELDFGVFAGLIDRLAAREPDWAHRLDIVFVGRSTIADFRSGGRFLDISHELPLRHIERAEDWLETWYLTRAADTPLAGPSVRSLVPPIETTEFLAAISGDIDNFVGAVRDDWRHGQVAYRVLTVCRVLRSLDSGAVCTKQEGAEWAAARFPDWAWLIEAALAVRAADGARELSPRERAAVRPFLALMAGEIRRARPTEPGAAAATEAP
jgi:streptomycin 3"-adenylyltransferase